MNLKKIITNTLAVVGAVVIVDKVIELVTTKGTKAVCEALNEEETNCDLDDNCECGCNDYVEDESPNQCEDHCSSSDQGETFPHIQKYENDEANTFEYTIKAENITSEPKEA